MSRLPRPCLSCRAPTRNGSRCPTCASQRERRRGSATQRGYDSKWSRKSQRLTKAIGCCQRCGIGHTEANPLTLDHIVAKARGGTDNRVQVLCRKCNSAKGARAA